MDIPKDRYLDRLIARKHNGMVKIVTRVRPRRIFSSIT